MASTSQKLDTRARDFGVNYVYAGEGVPPAVIVNVVASAKLVGLRLDISEVIHRVPLGGQWNESVFPAFICGVYSRGISFTPGRVLIFYGKDVGSLADGAGALTNHQPSDDEDEADVGDGFMKEDDEEGDDDDNDNDDGDAGGVEDEKEKDKPIEAAEEVDDVGADMQNEAAKLGELDDDVLADIMKNAKHSKNALCTVNGVVSPGHALEIMHTLAATLTRYDIPCIIQEARIHNMVSAMALGLGSIDPRRLKANLGANTNYNPVRINMVRITNTEIGLVFLVWPRDGCIIVAKARTVDQIAAGARWIFEQCRRAVSTEGTLTSDMLKRHHAEGPLLNMAIQGYGTNYRQTLRVLGYNVDDKPRAGESTVKRIEAVPSPKRRRLLEAAVGDGRMALLVDGDARPGAEAEITADEVEDYIAEYNSENDDSDDDPLEMAQSLLDDARRMMFCVQ